MTYLQRPHALHEQLLYPRTGNSFEPRQPAHHTSFLSQTSPTYLSSCPFQAIPLQPFSPPPPSCVNPSIRPRAITQSTYSRTSSSINSRCGLSFHIPAMLASRQPANRASTAPSTLVSAFPICRLGSSWCCEAVILVRGRGVCIGMQMWIAWWCVLCC